MGEDTLEAAIEWTIAGTTKRIRLERGAYFIGRPPGNTGLNPLKIYVFPPHASPIDTGYRDEVPVVSRLHLLLIHAGAEIIIVDHGPRGEGSKNGTIVNGRKLPPRGVYTLRPGMQARVQLTPRGPSFTITLSPEAVAEQPPARYTVVRARTSGGVGIVLLRLYARLSMLLRLASLGAPESTIRGEASVLSSPDYARAVESVGDEELRIAYESLLTLLRGDAGLEYLLNAIARLQARIEHVLGSIQL